MNNKKQDMSTKKRGKYKLAVRFSNNPDRIVYQYYFDVNRIYKLFSDPFKWMNKVEWAMIYLNGEPIKKFTIEKQWESIQQYTT